MIGGRGRPLRFVAVIAGCWLSVRIAFLWQSEGSLPGAIEALVPLGPASASVSVPRKPPPSAHPISTARIAAAASASSRPAVDLVGPRGSPERINLAMLGLISFGNEQVIGAPSGAFPRPAPVTVAIPDRAMPSAWSASAWFMTRRGAPAGGPMLGGDQAGLRVAHAVGRDRRMAIYGRISTPLVGPGRELAIGVEWQPTRAPVRLVAEQRIGLDGTAGGPTLGVVGGVSAVSLPFDFRLEAYGQAGAVARQSRIDPFADGAARITREVAAVGNTRLDIGAGAWGAAQRNAARLDVGPSAVATLPLGTRAVRLGVDWRQRIAGDAQPGSGPALTLGTDF